MSNKKFIRILFAALIVSGGFFLLAWDHAFGEMTGMQGHQQHAGYPAGGKEVKITLETTPASITTKSPATILFSFKDSEGKPVKLTPTHDRILHVIIASQDFSVFAHIHPEDFGPITTQMKRTAQFPLRYAFPKAGRYLMGVDFAVKEQTGSRYFVVEVTGEPKMGHLTKDFSRGKRVGDYDVILSSKPASIPAGEKVMLDYFFKKNGNPVTDLEPYLSAPMHLAIISSDLNYFIHTHGEVPGLSMTIHRAGRIHMTVPDKFGPRIEVHTVFPAKGVYQVFGEVKHKGKVIVTSFMVEVE